MNYRELSWIAIVGLFVSDIISPLVILILFDLILFVSYFYLVIISFPRH